MTKKGVGVSLWRQRPMKGAPTPVETQTEADVAKMHDDTEYAPIAVPIEGTRYGITVWMRDSAEEQHEARVWAQKAVDKLVEYVAGIHPSAIKLSPITLNATQSRVFRHSDKIRLFSVADVDTLAKYLRTRPNIGTPESGLVAYIK